MLTAQCSSPPTLGQKEVKLPCAVRALSPVPWPPGSSLLVSRPPIWGLHSLPVFVPQSLWEPQKNMASIVHREVWVIRSKLLFFSYTNQSLWANLTLFYIIFPWDNVFFLEDLFYTRKTLSSETCRTYQKVTACLSPQGGPSLGSCWHEQEPYCHDDSKWNFSEAERNPTYYFFSVK